MSLAARPRRRAAREPTVALINIVFLMLVFFLVAGTLSRPVPTEVSLVRTAELSGSAPPDALVLHPDGRLSHRGAPVADSGAFLAALAPADRADVRLLPDRALPAARLVAVAAALQAAGAGSVKIVTERGLR